MQGIGRILLSFFTPQVIAEARAAGLRFFWEEYVEAHPDGCEAVPLESRKCAAVAVYQRDGSGAAGGWGAWG